MRRVVALVLTVATATAHAGGFGIPEIGVRRTAMGSIIGRPDDASAIYHNPAGLILQHGWNVYASFGLSLLDTEFQLAPWAQSDHFLGVTAGADGYYKPVRPTRAYGVIPMIAATAEIIPDRLVLGAAVFVGNATGAKFAPNAVTRYHLIDAYIVAPQAVVAASYRLTDSLSVGASVGAIDVVVHEERELFPIVNLNGKPTDISFLSGNDPKLTIDGSGWAPTWMIGAFGQPHPRVTWGATVTGRVDAQVSGPITLVGSPPSGLYFPGTQHMTQLLPWTFTGGANVDVTDHVEIGSELRYWLYRQYQQQVVTIEDIPLISQLVTNKDYHDSWEASGGVRVHDLAIAPALELMAGTQYDHSPAPPRTVTLDQPSFTHWAVHSGARVRLGRYRLGASYIHYWYQIPTITDSITDPPSNVRGHGGNNIFTVSLEAAL
jgi:long-chain fatty acid transport protein